MFLDNSVVANVIALGVMVFPRFKMGRGPPPLGLPQRKHVWKPESEGIVPISPDFAGRLRRPANQEKQMGGAGSGFQTSFHRGEPGTSPPVVTKSNSLG